MEHINFGGRSSQEELGRGLARMHLAPVSVWHYLRNASHDRGSLRTSLMMPDLQDPNAQQGKFGFAVDNTIGGTEQVLS